MNPVPVTPPMRASVLVVLVVLLSSALPRAGADDTGQAMTQKEIGYCGTWHSTLGENPCHAESEATLVVTGCAGDHCDFVLTQRGSGHAAAPGLMDFGLFYVRSDRAEGDSMTFQSCFGIDEMQALAESIDPEGFHCIEVCTVELTVAASVGCSAETRDRAHIPPGKCSTIFDGAMFEYDLVEGAYTTPGFQICRDAAGAVSVTFA